VDNAGLRVTEDALYRWSGPEAWKVVGVPEASVYSHPAIMPDFQTPSNAEFTPLSPPKMPFLALRLPTHQGEEPFFASGIYCNPRPEPIAGQNLVHNRRRQRTGKHRPNAHPGDVSKIVSELKKRAKGLKGSIYVKDRREK